MKPLKQALFASALAVLPSLAFAADDKGSYHIIGAGARPCSEYLAATAEAKLYVETWLAGYTTAMNRATSQTYSLLGSATTEQMHSWLANWCQQNPQALVATGVHAMLEAAYPNRVQKSPN